MALKKHDQTERFGIAMDHELRDFHESHEPLPSEWDKQVGMVKKRRHKLWKITQLLGEKEELDNQYLMRQFPVIQRLQFTKWPAGELFVYSCIRFQLVSRAFVNQMVPTKGQMSAMVGVYFACQYLLNLMWLSIYIPNEDEPAMEKDLTDLAAMVYSQPLKPVVVVFAIVFEHVARLLRYLFHRHYFFHPNVNLNVLDDAQVKRDLVEDWHHQGNRALYNAATFTLIGLSTAAGVCALCPQRRAATVMQGILVTQLYGFVLYPLLAGWFLTSILLVAKTARVFDGLISYVPSLLDFEWQGVDRPEKLAKRLVQTEKESAILELLYHAGGLVIPDEESSDEEKDAFGKGMSQSVAAAEI
jgi:hypothetical protein